jgi:hypothetical protein
MGHPGFQSPLNWELRTYLLAASVAQPSAALPALRPVFGAARARNVASNAFPTQNGTAGGVHSLRYHLPQGAVRPATGYAYGHLSIVALDPAHPCFCEAMEERHDVRLKLR